jgi:mono/diheme cytochrome c family protein
MFELKTFIYVTRGEVHRRCVMQLRKTVTMLGLFLACMAIAILYSSNASSAPKQAPVSDGVARINYARDIQPIFAEHCVECHGPSQAKGGLKLTSRANAIAKLKSEVHAIVPGMPGESELLIRVAGTDPLVDIMPPPKKGKPLSAKQVEKLRLWIKQGAKWESHWAYRPIQFVKPPSTKTKANIRNAIDSFVVAKLDEKGIAQSLQADRATLIKRLSYDLVGLPPTLEEINGFVNDKTDVAYEKLVDRLLASRHYGERWGRHWLDKARYADSDGYEKDRPRLNAWRYRDWVIDAVNRDLPFDQFTIEQLAGDLLPNASAMQRLATAFHRQTLTNTEGGADKEQFRTEAVFDRTETTGSVWLGLTVGCARCHTHKYDQITQKEYFQLYAFFNSGNESNVNVSQTSGDVAKYRSQLEQYGKEVAGLTSKIAARTKSFEPVVKQWEKETQAALAKHTGKIEFVDAKVLSFLGPKGLKFKVMEDGSYLAIGRGPESGKYTIDMETTARGITGVRVDVLPHVSLGGKKGPGLSPHGNFVLSEIRVYANAKPGLKPEHKIDLTGSTADFSQKGWGVGNAIDGKEGVGSRDTGWGISPQFGKPHYATFSFSKALPSRPMTFVRVTLSQSYGSNHMIGRFKIRLRTGNHTDQIAPKKIRDILVITPAKRTDAQKQAIVSHVAMSDASIRELLKKLAQLKKNPPKAKTMSVRVISQGNRVTRILHRGDFLSPKEPVKTGSLATLTASLPLVSRTPGGVSDRLDFAHWLVDKNNPLTPRVAVNHVWHKMFGRGLVATINDFGVRGELPSHPNLFDWLAYTFSHELKWSRKRLLKLIVMSATYRQSSIHRTELREVDPTNILLYRQNRVRVEAEIVRDLYLGVSGLLSNRIGGPSVFPPLPPGVTNLSYANNFKWKTSVGEDRYRRGMYTFFKRTAPHPTLTTFDCPDANTSNTKRTVSNTPLQALATLNNEVYIEAAQALSKRVLMLDATDDATRLMRGMRMVMVRRPSASEVKYFEELLTVSRAYYKTHAEDAKKLLKRHAASGIAIEENAAWVATMRMVLNLDEFIMRD